MVLLDGAKGRCVLEPWRVAELVEILRVREENQMCVQQVLRALSTALWTLVLPAPSPNRSPNLRAPFYLKYCRANVLGGSHMVWRLAIRGCSRLSLNPLLRTACFRECSSHHSSDFYMGIERVI